MRRRRRRQRGANTGLSVGKLLFQRPHAAKQGVDRAPLRPHGGVKIIGGAVAMGCGGFQRVQARGEIGHGGGAAGVVP